nr:hypothetical protein Iba_chr11aCG0990 [Ipomoea batatas]GMD53374.1 hypothetical protein Iba_chr11cCG2030 [Ipomoea batatas]
MDIVPIRRSVPQSLPAGHASPVARIHVQGLRIERDANDDGELMNSKISGVWSSLHCWECGIDQRKVLWLRAEGNGDGVRIGRFKEYQTR